MLLKDYLERLIYTFLFIAHFHFLVPYYINVEISHYTKGKNITFEGESIFEPVFNLKVTAAPKRRSKLSLQIYYKRNSLLFQVTLNLSISYLVKVKTLIKTWITYINKINIFTLNFSIPWPLFWTFSCSNNFSIAFLACDGWCLQ